MPWDSPSEEWDANGLRWDQPVRFGGPEGRGSVEFKLLTGFGRFNAGGFRLKLQDINGMLTQAPATVDFPDPWGGAYADRAALGLDAALYELASLDAENGDR